MGKSKIYNYTKEELQELLDTSNSYTDILHKIGICGGSSIDTLKRIIKEYNLSEDLFYINYRSLKQKCRNNNSKKDVSEYLYKGSKVSSHNLKNKLIESGLKECKCECCGLVEWLGKPIKLHLHHKDGDHYNNELSNLQLLCPNCHSYTDNYGFYNSEKYQINKRKEKIKKITNTVKENLICPQCGEQKSYRAKLCFNCFNKNRIKDTPVKKEELSKLIKNYSFTEIGKMYNVSDNAIRNWCVKHGLPSTKKEINENINKDI